MNPIFNLGTDLNYIHVQFFIYLTEYLNHIGQEAQL